MQETFRVSGSETQMMAAGIAGVHHSQSDQYWMFVPRALLVAGRNMDRMISGQERTQTYQLHLEPVTSTTGLVLVDLNQAPVQDFAFQPGCPQVTATFIASSLLFLSCSFALRIQPHGAVHSLQQKKGWQTYGSLATGMSRCAWKYQQLH